MPDDSQIYITFLNLMKHLTFTFVIFNACQHSIVNILQTIELFLRKETKVPLTKIRNLIKNLSTMAPQQKGKQGTKGAKQIVEENKGTLSFYRNMALGSAVGSLFVNFIFYEIGKVTVIMSILALLTLGAAYQFMAFMSKPKFSETGALIDSGNDLNIEGGIAENVKDLIILTSGTMLLVLISNYFWFLLLLAPIRAIWMLWGSVIKPWLDQKNSQEEPEVNEKKQRKMERKMRRMR